MSEKVLLRHLDVPEIRKLDVYLAHSGYEAARKALTTLKPEEVTDQVKASNLRGRGGAGFVAGMKWGFLPKDSPKPVYLCCNADESEPGTFKDRAIIEWNTHILLEGILISAYAIKSHTAYIYIRGEFALGAKRLGEAIAEAYAKGLLGKNIFGTGYDLDVYVHRGAGAYICGEETGLIESLEGKRAYPRIKPPFPAVYGLFGSPTIVQNVETLACIPSIMKNGPAWFKAIGPETGPGPKIYCVSGHVEKPGLYELPMGMPLRTVIYDYAGGIRGGKKLKAVMPGGSSFPVLTPDEIDVNMDFDSMRKINAFLGTAGIIVMDEDTCMVRALEIVDRFYHHESCGQCTPCREGTGWLHKLLVRLEEGNGQAEDIDLMNKISDNMMGNTVCVLADAAAMPTQSYIGKFRDEFIAHVTLGRCPLKKEEAAHRDAA
ncbi:MAG TPA: NADH-quinone oxidoreductase subunit NuoF [Candidatus Binatia bacterium]|jgi:NADH-quinone oxidoreductase subunit F|nr:NADH-quinone oxidoreductase subunit NuoF [Candidatus Binatia bacterium]